jgi:hypothetical protein
VQARLEQPLAPVGQPPHQDRPAKGQCEESDERGNLRGLSSHILQKRVRNIGHPPNHSALMGERLRFGLRSLVLVVALLPTVALVACSLANGPGKASSAREASSPGTPGPPTGGPAAGTNWMGTIDSDTFRAYTDNKGAVGNRCQTSWHSAVAFAVTSGKVAGHGTSTLVGKASCVPIADAGSLQETSETFDIGGTQQVQSFHLILSIVSGAGGQGESGGEVLLFTLTPCQQQFTPRELVVPIQGADVAAGPADADVTVTCGGGAADQFSNHSRISLRLVKS